MTSPRFSALCVLLLGSVAVHAAIDWALITSPANQKTTWVSTCYLIENTDTKISFDDYDPGALGQVVVDPDAGTITASIDITQTSTCKTSAVVTVDLTMKVLQSLSNGSLTLWQVNLTDAGVTINGQVPIDDFSADYDPTGSCALQSGVRKRVSEQGCGNFFSSRSACQTRWFATQNNLQFANFFDQKDPLKGCNDDVLATRNFTGLPTFSVASGSIPTYNISMSTSGPNPQFAIPGETVTISVLTSSAIEIPSVTFAGNRYTMTAQNSANTSFAVTIPVNSFSSTVTDGAILNQLVSLPPLRTPDLRFVFSSPRVGTTTGTQIELTKSGVPSVDIRVLVNNEVVSGSQFAQEGDVVEARISGSALLASTLTVQLGLNVVSNNAEKFVNFTRDDSKSSDSLLRFFYTLQASSADPAGRVIVRVINRKSGSGVSAADQTVGISSTFTVTIAYARIASLELPAVANPTFDEAGQINLVVKCKPAGSFKWTIRKVDSDSERVAAETEEAGWRAAPNTFPSDKETVVCSEGGSALALDVASLGLQKKSKYYLYARAIDSPTIDGPKTFFVPDKYSCFPGNSQILKADASTSSIESLTIGDKIQSFDLNGHAETADVVYLRTHTEAESVDMLHVHYVTAVGKAGTLRVTPLHSIYVATEDSEECAAAPSQSAVTLAAGLMEGSQVWVTTETGDLMPAVVEAVLVSKEKTTYSVISSTGRMVVDGVLVSSYGSLGFETAHFVHGWHRMWYSISPAIVKSAFFQAFDEFAISCWTGNALVRSVVNSLAVTSA